MHPTSTKHQFIELRAQGLSLTRIAEKIGVSKRTLIDWNREHQAQIDGLRAAELEALHERLLASHEQQLTRLVSFQRQIEDELDNRSVKALSIEKLFRLSFQVRREIRSLCAAASPARNTLHSVPEVNTTNGPSSQIKPNQTPDIFSAAEPLGKNDTSAAPSSVQSSELSGELPIQNQNSKIENSPAPQPSQEHCLHCGDPLPPLLPDGTRPSPWCACGSPIAAPPGLSIRELCPYCSAPVPVHGYNVKRSFVRCAQCDQILPSLDPNAPLKWLPPDSEIQKRVPSPTPSTH